MRRQRVAVIGIGSPHGDDQIGWKVIDEIERIRSQETGWGSVACRQVVSPIDSIQYLDGLERLLLCDASRGLSAAGAVSRWEWPFPAELTEAGWSGTHDVSLITAITLAATLHRLPATVVLYGIEIAEIPQPMRPITDQAQNAAKRAAQMIANELRKDLLTYA